MKKNRLIALLSAAAMTAALLTGCGGGGGGASNPGGGSGSGNQGGTPAPAGAEAVTIWYYWETEDHQVALDKVITGTAAPADAAAEAQATIDAIVK